MAKHDNNKSLHPSNLHKAGYDFELLIKENTDLEPFVMPNKYGNLSIDFSDADAVFKLNKALLKTHYNLSFFAIPKGNLCPPIPGRADYIHHINDLISSKKGGTPLGLDIGTGANCIYPLLGNSIYQWNFVASDISRKSLLNAEEIIQKNTNLKGLVEFRLQRDSEYMFDSIIQEGEFFDFTICNPPFHDSKAAAVEGTERKWQNLKQEKGNSKLNFGGQDQEIWYEGGEKSFIHRMIKESTFYKEQVGWFTTLVSKKDNIKGMKKSLEKFAAKEIKVIPMHQGNKITRILAWRF